MEKFFRSEGIDIFPSTERVYNTSGKLTSEYNFVNIINSIVDENSYVLFKKDGKLKLVINGYYFSCDDTVGNSASCYARIVCEKGGNKRLVRVDGNISANTLDSSGKFYGIVIGDLDTVKAETAWVDQFQNDYDIYQLLITDENGSLNKLRLAGSSSYFDTDTNVSGASNVVDGKISVSAEMDLKQYKLSPINTDKGLGVLVTNTAEKKGSKKASTSTIEFNPATTTLLDSMMSTSVGDDNQPVYFKNGQVMPINGKAGSDYDGFKEQTMFMKGGKMHDGFTVYVSAESPKKDQGKPGDIWFKVK